MKKKIDIKKLNETFKLVDGELFRVNKASGNLKKVESKANLRSGYCAVGFDGGMYHMSRIVMALHTGEDIPEGMEISHKNGNRHDNQINNLEILTRRETAGKRKCHRDGDKVVGAFKNGSKYTASVGVGGTVIHLGVCKTEKEAGELYQLACLHLDEYEGDAKDFRKLLSEVKYNSSTKPIGKY